MSTHLPHTVTREQVLAFRLAQQHLAARLPRGALIEAARCGIQNTPPGTAALALHARVAGLTPADLDRSYGWAVAADPEQPDLWYISAAPAPFKAHSENDAQAIVFRNEGAHWRQLAGGLPQPLDHMPYALLTERGAPGQIYAGLSNGAIWRSADYGDHWEQLPFSLGKIERSLIML